MEALRPPLNIFALLDRVAGLLPGCIPAEDGIDPRKAELKQAFRRTGGGFFSRSGTVGDNPLVGVQRVGPGIQQGQWYVDRTWNMTRFVGRRVANIQEERLLIIKGSLRFFQRDALYGHLGGCSWLGSLTAGWVGSGEQEQRHG